MKCENDSSMGHTVIQPQCVFGTATKEVTIHYNTVEKDTVNLCDACAKELAKDARRHGYKVTIARL